MSPALFSLERENFALLDGDVSSKTPLFDYLSNSVANCPFSSLDVRQGNALDPAETFSKSSSNIASSVKAGKSVELRLVQFAESAPFAVNDSSNIAPVRHEMTFMFVHATLHCFAFCHAYYLFVFVVLFSFVKDDYFL